MKKNLFLIALLVLSVTSSFSQSGKCGNELTWTYNSSTKTLTITGVGAMSNYDNVISLAPWRSFYDLQTVIIETGVTSIGEYAFFKCSNLTSISIPASVTSIEEAAFASCANLTSITIPEGVTSIGPAAFGSCVGLTTVNFNATKCTMMGSFSIPVFGNCENLRTVNIGSNVTVIPSCAFLACLNLTSVTIPGGVTNIGSYAFALCIALTSVTIPDGVASIENYTFAGCNVLTSVTIPSSVTSIGMGAFESCSALTSVTIPESVKSIGAYAFVICGALTSVTIPDGVASIEGFTFAGCGALTSITIPSSVTSIGMGAFEYCSALKNIYAYRISPPSAVNNSFYGVDKSSCTLHVPIGSKQQYAMATAWQDFLSIQESLSARIETIEANPFLRIYPNPVSENFYIGGISQSMQITVLDVNGKIVLKRTVVPGEAISVQHLPKGIYVVQAEGKTMKMIINR
ncbi:MAG: leucine-rich repeat protein [Dysgonamonadaceae bacterium]|jgi:hypothetical protein|nr:leucine-rich repeat protein [Dysgonamonadaceae bacterium]